MKILDSKINQDGHYELLVQYERVAIVRETAIIPTRAFLISQGQTKLESVSDEDYLQQAIAALKDKCELPPEVEKSAANRARGLIGLEF